jgi:branched-chain amino acid transport system substrate-binding protein
MRRARTVATWLLAAAALAACGQDDAPSDAPRVATPLASSVCSPVTYGGEGRPRFVLALVAPLQNAFSDHGVQNAQAVKLVLHERGWRAGDHRVGLQVCDESSDEDYVDLDKCERTARAIAANRSVLAVLGPTLSSCAGTMLPILNRAPGGPVALAGTGNTYLGLTRGGPGVEAGDPDAKYPTGRRSYLRTVPADDAQAAAGALALAGVGARRLFALHDGDSYGRGLAASALAAAERSGMASAGLARWDAEAEDYRALARRVRASRADAVYLGGYVTSNGPRLVRDLRDALGPDVPFAAPDGFNQPTALVEGAGERADGLLITLSAVPNRELPARGRAWARVFEHRYGARPCCYAVHAGQVTELALDAIAGADGRRDRVVERLLAADVRGGLVGDFRFDRHGDSTLRTISAYRIRGGRLRYERSIEVPQRLLTRR